MTAARRLSLQTPSGHTDVILGAGVRGDLDAHLQQWCPEAERVAVVVDAHVAAAWPDPAIGREVLRIEAPAGEAAKTRDVLARLQDELLALRRHDVVVAIGGGAVLDATGFAAATVRRGLPWVAVATSVVAMADAAIGGKVAINHARGKNLLGTFHPPRGVLADVAYLDTLPKRERIAGLAEAYKCGRLGAPDVLTSLAQGVPATPEAWVALLTPCAQLKARVVEADERDHGERRLLNFGHSVGHALERLLGAERMRHGEAVAIGMVAATHLAAARDWTSADAPTSEAKALAQLGLPTAIPEDASTDELLTAVAQDKKRGAGRAHTFVLPRRDTFEIATDVTDDEVRTAIDATR